MIGVAFDFRMYVHGAILWVLVLLIFDAQ